MYSRTFSHPHSVSLSHTLSFLSLYLAVFDAKGPTKYRWTNERIQQVKCLWRLFLFAIQICVICMVCVLQFEYAMKRLFLPLTKRIKFTEKQTRTHTKKRMKMCNKLNWSTEYNGLVHKSKRLSVKSIYFLVLVAFCILPISRNEFSVLLTHNRIIFTE